ncbi:MAG TPA: lamin tail domain-containing protein [Planctomycetota bacterium]|nr:lamin tail domain-containing protein [Planctomycetota bacterium]
MTNRTGHPLTAALLVSTLAISLPRCLPAQDVLLNEVRADGADRWIELYNRGASAVDLSTWSLHFASRTPNVGQNYWWPFPAGTTIAANGFLRVHWFQLPPATPAPGELYTGTGNYNFLFGLGGEALVANAGALGLLSSQQNSMMNTASIFEDWVSWGDHDFVREHLAVEAGVWTAGRQAPPILPGNSLARELAAVGVAATRDQEWYLDSTPTPMLPNFTGASVQPYGSACVLPGNHLLGVPQLHTNTPPLLGNAAFAFDIDSTTGIYGEFVLVVFSAGAAPPGAPSLLPPFAGVGCHESIHTGLLLAMWLRPTHVVSTAIPLSLANQATSLVGAEMHVQCLVFDLLPYAYPPYQGITNALRIVFGQ